MRKATLRALLLLCCLLLTASSAHAEEGDFFEPDLSAMLWGDSAFDPEDADPMDPNDQELGDAPQTSVPVPPEARRQQLYIVDAQTQMLPCASWMDDEQLGEGGMEIAQLFQFQFQDTLCYWSGTPKSVATSGCGATSMSMVIAYLTGNRTQNPYTLFRWAINNGLYSGSGLSHEALLDIGAMHGVGGLWVRPDEVLIRSALRQGYPVIAHMGPGTFTKRGHYIVLRGLTEDGQIRVNDPNSKENSDAVYDYSEIVRQTKTIAPFMLCFRVDE